MLEEEEEEVGRKRYESAEVSQAGLMHASSFASGGKDCHAVIPCHVSRIGPSRESEDDTKAMPKMPIDLITPYNAVLSI